MTVRLVGTDTAGVPVSVRVGDRRTRQALASPTRPVTLPMAVQERGWVPLTVELAPDELRGDDLWSTIVRVAPPARVRWDPSDRYMSAAFEVLRDGGRVIPGGDISVGTLGPGASLVLPPADPAQVGAVNRALASRGVTWRFGSLVQVPGSTDSGAARRGARGAPLRAAVGRIGRNRCADPGGWRALAGPEWGSGPGGKPLRPGMDCAPHFRQIRPPARCTGQPDCAGRTRIALRSAWRSGADARPGRPRAAPGRTVPVEGGSLFRPAGAGLHFLLSGQDTIGVVSVNPDPRESDLTRATDRAVTRALEGVARRLAR